MAFFRRMVVTLVGAFVACDTASGQTYATDALQHGSLVVWVVAPPRPAKPTADQERSRLHTTTAGSFGQTAGSGGRTASGYGRSPSDLPSRVTSQAASDGGRRRGALGRV